jgi:transmembrane sensor
MGINLHNDKKQEFNDMSMEEKILWLSGQYEVPQTLSKEAAWMKLKAKMQDSDQNVRTRSINLPKRRTIIYSVAASLALLLTCTWLVWRHNSSENVFAERGQQTDFQLPDGSNVLLNADTKISFHRVKFRRERYLTLNGEAFFSVKKGNPFVISTKKANIRVLGTSFNVYARDESFRVSCFTGKIQVTDGKQTVIIVPTETAYIENNKLLVQRENNINTTAIWRVGEFTFDKNASLKSVFDEIERQFNVTFVLSNVDVNTIFTTTATFSNKNLGDALDIICTPMGLTYEIRSNSKIYIRGKAK